MIGAASPVVSEVPRLEMRGIGKSFDGTRVLGGVDLTVGPGEVVALLGANGAGKSTLMKILTGVYPRDTGEIRIDGQVADIATPRRAAQHGISFLPQEISVIPEMTVAENISIAHVPLGRRFGLRVVDASRMRSLAADILKQLGFEHISPDTYLSDLSVAECRIVEIARALASKASLLVMDEPTASLTQQEAAMIFRIVRRLKEQRTAVIYISHYLREVFEIADRIEVLRDGRNAGSFVSAETKPEAVVEAMLGAAVGDLYAPRGTTPSAVPRPLFEAKDLATRSGLRGISFRVGVGEIVGVFGLVGSGIEHLGRLVYGADGGGYDGTMTLAGEPYVASTPANGKAAGIGFVTAERKKDGILADLSVRENLVAPFQKRYGRGIFASKRRETEQTLAWIKGLGIKARGPEQDMRLLSGGNQQKVCVARWLVPSVRMLILEEPTRGVDVGARRELYSELGRLARQGLAILVLSSDVEEIAGLSDRSLVIDRGAIVGRFPSGTEAGRLMEATTGPATAGRSNGVDA